MLARSLARGALLHLADLGGQGFFAGRPCASRQARNAGRGVQARQRRVHRWADADNKGIFHPTYRSIEALRAVYVSESQTFGSRSVLGNAGAASSGSFPTNIWTQTSTGKNYAMAYNSHSMFTSRRA